MLCLLLLLVQAFPAAHAVQGTDGNTYRVRASNDRSQQIQDERIRRIEACDSPECAAAVARADLIAAGREMGRVYAVDPRSFSTCEERFQYSVADGIACMEAISLGAWDANNLPLIQASRVAIDSGKVTASDIEVPRWLVPTLRKQCGLADGTPDHGLCVSAVLARVDSNFSEMSASLSSSSLRIRNQSTALAACSRKFGDSCNQAWAKAVASGFADTSATERSLLDGISGITRTTASEIPPPRRDREFYCAIPNARSSQASDLPVCTPQQVSRCAPIDPVEEGIRACSEEGGPIPDRLAKVEEVPSLCALTQEQAVALVLPLCTLDQASRCDLVASRKVLSCPPEGSDRNFSAAGKAPCRLGRLFGGAECGQEVDVPMPHPCDHLPKKLCGEHARFHPDYYDRKQLDVARTRGLSRPASLGPKKYTSIEQERSFADGSYPISDRNLEIANDIYELEKKNFEAQALPFIVEIQAQEALQKAWLRGDDPGLVVKRLKNSLSCFSGPAPEGSGVGDEDYRVAGRVLHEKIDRAASALLMLKQRRIASKRLRNTYRNQVALAGQCLGAIQNRIRKLAYDLALDVELVTENPSARAMEDLDQAAARVDRFGETSRTLAQIGAAALKSAWSMSGMHAMLSSPGISGARKAAERPCSLFAAADPKSAMECRNIAQEFAILSLESQELARIYPESVLLAPPGQARPVHPRIKGYNAHFADPFALDPSDGGSSRNTCMKRLRKNPSRVDSPFLEASDADLAEADRAIQSSRSHLAETESLLEDLCDPKNWKDASLTVVTDPELAASYFSCERTFFPGLYALAGESPVRSVSPEECARTTNSSWMACRSVTEAESTRRLRKTGQDALRAGMFLLAAAGPVLAGSGAAGFTVWGSGAAKSVMLGSSLGVGVGVGLNWTFRPDLEQFSREARLEEMLCRSGVRVGDAGLTGCESALRAQFESLGDLDDRQAVIDGIIDGALGGWIGAGEARVALQAALPGAVRRQKLQAFLNLHYATLNSARDAKGAAAAGIQVFQRELVHRIRNEIRPLRNVSPKLKGLRGDQWNELLESDAGVISLAVRELYRSGPVADADVLRDQDKYQVLFDAVRTSDFHSADLRKHAMKTAMRWKQGGLQPPATYLTSEKSSLSTEWWKRLPPEIRIGTELIHSRKSFGHGLNDAKPVEILVGTESGDRRYIVRYLKTPDPKKGDRLDSAYGDVGRKAFAAWKLNRMLGMETVPEARVAQVGNKPALLVDFAPGEMASEHLGMTAEFRDLVEFGVISEHSFSDAQVFEFLVGNADVHHRNFHIDLTTKRVTVFDYDQAFSQVIAFPPNQRVARPMGLDLPERIRPATLEAVRRELGGETLASMKTKFPELAEQEILGILFRRDILLSYAKQRGEDILLKEVPVKPASRGPPEAIRHH